MRDRAGSWHGTSARWAERSSGPVPDQADPTGGRHAFDHDAALTPIFSTLRRGGWRPSRAPLRLVPDTVDRYPHGGVTDEPTMLLPVVAPLYADGYADDRGPSAIDPYAPASFAPPEPAESPTEATMWWRSPVAAPPLVAVPDDASAYDDASYDAGPYGYDPEPYDPYDRAAYGPGPEDSGPFHLLRPDRELQPVQYHPRRVTDSGRHHHRLAPAGW